MRSAMSSAPSSDKTMRLPCITSAGPSTAIEPAAVIACVCARSMTAMNAAIRLTKTRVSCKGRRARRGANASMITETTPAVRTMTIGRINR